MFRIWFFNNCIEKNQNKTHFEEGSHESLYYLTIIPTSIWYHIYHKQAQKVVQVDALDLSLLYFVILYNTL